MRYSNFLKIPLLISYFFQVCCCRCRFLDPADVQDIIWVACKTGRDFIIASPLCHCEHCYCAFRGHGVFVYVYFVNGSGLLILFEECLSALTCVIKTYAAQQWPHF